MAPRRYRAIPSKNREEVHRALEFAQIYSILVCLSVAVTTAWKLVVFQLRKRESQFNDK